MIKYPFSARGIADFQAGLYLLDKPALIKGAQAVAADFLSSTAHHFELEVYLLDKLHSLSEAMRLLFRLINVEMQRLKIKSLICFTC